MSVVGAYNPYAPPSDQPGSAPPPNVMSLPPIQHLNPPAANMQSQPRHYSAASLSNGAPGQSQHPPPYPPPNYHYPTDSSNQHGADMQQQAQIQIQAANGQSSGSMRFPIQPQLPSERQISGGRHKKEIKRRTKTGCLTCRKRRIKCDEGHPTCRNCQKSKRECLGYDPIFKQTPIQPANIQPLPPQNSHSQQQHQHHHQHQHHSPNLHSQPHHQRNHQQHSLQTQQHPAQRQQYHQRAPQHEGGSATSTIANNQYQSPSYPPLGGALEPHQPRGTDAKYDYTSPLDPELGLRSPQSSRMSHSSNYATALQPQRSVKQLQIDDLYALKDIPPRFNAREQPPPLPSSTVEQIGAFYRFNYAAGLDRLFETSWFTQRGLAYLNYSPLLQDFISQVMEQMSSKDEPDNNAIMSLEARLVWQLAILPRYATTYANTDAGGDPQLAEVLPRVDTLECLLTGQFLDPDKVSPPPQAQPPTPAQDSSAVNQKYNEQSFWHHLSKFVSYHDDHPSGIQGVNESLGVIRNILAMLENRDVLYSMAIARHIGGRLPGFDPHRHLPASNNDVADEINKLKVAHHFVENEEQRGTSQVIQRVCSMAIRSWTLQKQ